MTRYAARVDDNHTEVINALKQLGYLVIDMASVGAGFPDIVIYASRLQDLLPVEIWLAEIVGTEKFKKYKKAGGLNPRQVIFHEAWQGKPILVFKNVGDVLQFHNDNITTMD